MSSAATRQLTVAISGASGLIGSALARLLTSHGHQVRRLVRSAPQGDDIFWNPAEGQIDQDKLASVDAVVNLAGENIATGRWTEAKKQRIRDSRVDGTALLARTLAELPEPSQKAFLCASAIGYYDDRGDELMTESSGPGAGLLAQVGQQWEAAAQPAREAGIRVANMRIGVVLSTAGGALPRMLTPFKLGLGGVLGSGRQYMSWIHRDDLVAAIEWLLTNDTAAGPFNLVAPHPVTNREFTRTLGQVLGRPTLLPVPAFAIRLALGEMGQDLLLSSTRVEPHRLLESGFVFQYPELEGALRQLIESGA